MSGDDRKHEDRGMLSGATPEPDGLWPDDPSDGRDSGYLIAPLIDTPLTAAQRAAAWRVIEQCSAKNMGPGETALVVLWFLHTRRDFGPLPAGKQTDAASFHWIEATARLVNPPSSRGARGMSQRQAIKTALAAMEDVYLRGKTRRRGFEHMEQPWYTNKRTARLPAESTFRKRLAEFLRERRPRLWIV